MTTQLAFHNTHFDIVDRSGQPWLRSTQIAEALGYANDNAITRIYNRNADEFTAGMSEKVSLTLSGNLQTEARIFSLRGAHLLAMFARTKVAKEFRRWVLDVLDNLGAATQPQRKGKQKALPCGLAIEQQDAIKALVKARVEGLPENRRAKAAITCWSSLKSKFGCTYKEIQPEQFTDAISLVARVDLEGELLPAEPAPQPSPAAAIRMPLEWLFENNPRLNRERPLIMRPHGLLLSMGTLGAIDRSAVVHLLDQLAEMGADVAAPRAEIEAWRHFTGQMLATAAMLTDQAKRMADRLNDTLSMGYLLDKQSGRPRR